MTDLLKRNIKKTVIILSLIKFTYSAVIMFDVVFFKYLSFFRNSEKLVRIITLSPGVKCKIINLIRLNNRTYHTLFNIFFNSFAMTMII